METINTAYAASPAAAAAADSRSSYIRGGVGAISLLTHVAVDAATRAVADANLKMNAMSDADLNNDLDLPADLDASAELDAASYANSLTTSYVELVEECGRYTTFADIPSVHWQVCQ